MKCPNCRKGKMFVNKSIFPLKELMNMPEHCCVCRQKMELEVGFWYGTGFVSYALSVLILALFFIAYWLVFGMSYKDNSVYYALGLSVSIVIILQPWLMRISRVLYLYLFVKYSEGSRHKSEE
jgi:hypothetical protein